MTHFNLWMNERSAAIGRDSLPPDSSLNEYMVFATQGFISRKNTAPFAEFNGTVIWLVCFESGMLTQFVPRPVARLFVCDCNCQPV